MHFAFSSDQIQMRDAVRGALETECPAKVVREAWTSPPDHLWPLLAGLGVLGINAPEEAGGMGMGCVDWVLLLEESGRAALPAPLVETIAAVPFLFEAGESELAKRIVAGDATIAIAHEDGYAADADTADAVLQVQGHQISMVQSPTCTPQPALDGARRLFSVSGSLAPLSGDGEALVHRASLATSAQLVGLGHRILDMAVAYAKERTQFKKPIGSFQAVQHHLVDALLKLRFAGPMVHRAAWSLDEKHPDRSVHIAMAKIAAAEAAQLSCRKSLQVHGAIGYTLELDLHMWMKRVWSLCSAWGDPAHHRRTAAAHALGDTHA